MKYCRSIWKTSHLPKVNSAPEETMQISEKISREDPGKGYRMGTRLREKGRTDNADKKKAYNVLQLN